MARTVEDIMNRAVFYIRPGCTCRDALNSLLALGICGTAVARDDGRPLGMVSWHDLVRRGEDRVDEHMTPARAVAQNETIDEAAYRLAEGGLQRLIVVDERGKIAGSVSIVDVLRALTDGSQHGEADLARHASSTVCAHGSLLPH